MCHILGSFLDKVFGAWVCTELFYFSFPGEIRNEKNWILIFDVGGNSWWMKKIAWNWIKSISLLLCATYFSFFSFLLFDPISCDGNPFQFQVIRMIFNRIQEKSSHVPICYRRPATTDNDKNCHYEKKTIQKYLTGQRLFQKIVKWQFIYIKAQKLYRNTKSKKIVSYTVLVFEFNECSWNKDVASGFFENLWFCHKLRTDSFGEKIHLRSIACRHKFLVFHSLTDNGVR